MTQIRLVEHELEDRRVWMIAGLLQFNWDECDCEPEEYLRTYWKECIDALGTHPGWQNGGHEGDCTKVPASCMRCQIESLVDEAKQLIEKYVNTTPTE